MKIIEYFKSLFFNISNWVDRRWGPDRLSTQPRKIHSDLGIKKLLRDFRKSYYFSRKCNIAITGGETAGKKSFVKTFEETRYIPIGKFLHIDFRRFIEECGYEKDIQSLQAALDVYIEKCIIPRAKAGEIPGLNDRLVRGSGRIYKKPLFSLIVLIIMGGLLSTMNQWSNWLINLLPNTWDVNAINLSIMGCCIVVIALCCISIVNTTVAMWPLKWIDKIKASSKHTELEISTGSNTRKNEYNQTIIYILCKFRWQIGHTVVFENMDVLPEEAFRKITAHLCDLNTRVNNHGNSWKLWDVSPFKRPIRFLYIYRNDLVQIDRNQTFFDKIFYILPNITVDNVFYELKKIFEIEVSKGIKVPVDKLFPFDPNYMAYISKYLVNRRLLNEIVQHYINEYEDFILRTVPSDSDLHKLFSFVVYGLFFPKDRAKFVSRTSAIFCNSDEKNDIDPQYRDLHEYITSHSCPDMYRVDYLCMRFVGLCPELLEEHIEHYEQAYQKGDYQTALTFIEKAICCLPEDVQLRNTREMLLQRESNLLSK